MTILLIIAALIQVLYWYHFFRPLALHQSPSTSLNSHTNPVSVVICAKNEAYNLKENLPSVLNQHYDDYEIIVADDHSIDETQKILKKIVNEKRILSVYEVKQNSLGKKQALWEGLVNSRHNWVLLTDADCRPRSENWINVMQLSLSTSDHKIILGYSPYVSNGSAVSYWAQFEAWITGIMYLSLALRGKPYMGVGRNLSYDKTLLSRDMLLRHSHLASGDDDLVIMQMANADNTTICLDPDGFVDTQAPPSWAAYFRQKTRHFSTASSYKLPTIFILSGFSLSQLLFHLLFLLSLFTGHAVPALVIYALRLLLISPVMLRTRQKLKATFTPLAFPILDFGLAIYYLVFSFSVLYPKRQAW